MRAQTERASAIPCVANPSDTRTHSVVWSKVRLWEDDPQVEVEMGKLSSEFQNSGKYRRRYARDFTVEPNGLPPFAIAISLLEEFVS